jgi:hypothetical protein
MYIPMVKTRNELNWLLVKLELGKDIANAELPVQQTSVHEQET